MITGWFVHRLPSVQYSYKYELFYLGCLLIWFSLWRQEYRIDAPVFLYYPIYFILVNGLVSFLLINNDALHRPGSELLREIRTIYRSSYLQETVLITLTVGSLLIPKLYLAYPLLASLVSLRYAIITCLRNEPIVYMALGNGKRTLGLFADQIYPIAKRYGPVLAFVRRPLLPDSPYRNLRLYSRRGINWISRDHWRRSVRSALGRCFVLILDIRHAISDPGWELDVACSTLSRDKIAVIYDVDSGAQSSTPVGVLRLRVDDEKGIRECSASLEQWFKGKTRLSSR